MRHGSALKYSISYLPLLCCLMLLMGCGGGTSGSGINTYEGRVLTEDGEPLENVRVTVEKTGDSTYTNSTGDFVLLSAASGPEVTILAETDSFSGKITVNNVLEEDSRVRVNVTINELRKTASKTDFNVRAKMVGLCDYYFENRSVIRQANHVPKGTTCSISVEVLANGQPLSTADVALQYASCAPDAVWHTLSVAQTGSETDAGNTKISFVFESSRSHCRYRIVAPYEFSDAWPVYYPIDTFAEQSHRQK